MNRIEEGPRAGHPRISERAVLVYALLILGSALFLWPFLWMIGTSLKSGREMLSSPLSLLPELPVRQDKSPYLAPRPVKEAADGDLLQAIERRVRALDYPWPDFVPPRVAIPQVSNGILRRLRLALPGDAWKLPPPELDREITSRIDHEAVTQALNHDLRRLALGEVWLRFEGHVDQQLVSGGEAATAWQVGGNAPASLEPATDEQRPCAVVHYDLARGGSVTFSRTFRTARTVDGLNQIQLSLRYDESWNFLTIRVEKQGALYEATATTPLGSAEHWNVAAWREPRSDDVSNEIKTWTNLRKIAVGPRYLTDPHQLKITLEIHRAGLLRAWWEKLSRNYAVTLDYIPFWRYTATSLFLVVLNIVGTLFSCSLVAYSFARLRWPGRDLCFVVMLAGLMIPPQVTLIPQFLIFRHLGFYNTLFPLWVPSFLGAPFYIFLLRQFFKGIPRDLEEAARIDGCGFFRIYWHIMLPQVKPSLAAIAILTFIAAWNDFMGPLIYVSDQRLYPLSFGLYAFDVQAGTDPALSMGITIAGSLMMTLPVIAIFFLAQKYFIRGVTFSGIK